MINNAYDDDNNYTTQHIKSEFLDDTEEGFDERKRNSSVFE